MSPNGRSSRAPGSVGVAVVGYGSGAQHYHVPYLKALDGFSVSAIVCGAPDRRAKARADFPQATVYDSVAAMLKHGADADLAVVVTPNSTHAQVSRSLLGAGFDLVIDKPIALTAGEARSVVSDAARMNRVVVPYLNRRWDSDFVAVQRAVSSGEPGRVRELRSRVDRWRPVAKNHWSARTRHEAGGGMIYGFGPHLVDQALLLLGPVEAVSAKVACLRVPGVPDEFELELTHATGARSIVGASDLTAPSAARPRFEIRGSATTIRTFGMDAQEAVIRSGVHPSDKALWDEALAARAPRMQSGDTSESARLPSTSALEFWIRLGRYLRGNGPVPADPVDAIAGLAVLDAAYESWRGQTEIRVEKAVDPAAT